jgi:hypothetical protein
VPGARTRCPGVTRDLDGPEYGERGRHDIAERLVRDVKRGASTAPLEQTHMQLLTGDRDGARAPAQ